MATPIAVTMTQPSPTSEGLLSQALALPDGWQRGGIEFLDPNCLAPTVMGQCPSGEGLKPTERAETAGAFRSVDLIQAVECSTMGGLDVRGIADAEGPRTASFALARELLTGAASLRDNPTGQENPALVNTATDLGADFTTVAAALGCLESSLNSANSGRGGVVLMSIGFATVALAERVLWRDGARWRTVTGAPVIIDAGFDGRAPVADGTGVPPADNAPLYAYATTAVWAGTGRSDTFADVNRSINTSAARREQVGMAAFSTCAVFAAASTAATAC
jgi:hypothetical protein